MKRITHPAELDDADRRYPLPGLDWASVEQLTAVRPKPKRDWTGVLVVAASALCCVALFLAGYLIEKSLSVDNVFVFALLLSTA